MPGDYPKNSLHLVDAATRVIDCTLSIVQQELELARLELVDTLPRLGRGLIRLALGAVLGAVAAVLAVLALVWALADYVFGFQHVWASFAVVALLALLGAALLVGGALRRTRQAGAPLPRAAIRQARALREAVRS